MGSAPTQIAGLSNTPMRSPEDALMFLHPFHTSIAILLLIGTVQLRFACAEEVAPRPISDQVLQDDLQNQVRPFLQKYCFDCHEGDSAEAGVDLARYDSLDQLRESSSVWEQVKGLIKLGAMPPPDHTDLPNDEERALATRFIEDALHYVDCSDCYAPAPITVRRLNAVEYDHAVRDLFGIDISPSRAIGLLQMKLATDLIIRAKFLP